MKMVKKILFGTLVAVTLAALVGCKPEAGGNSDMFDVGGLGDKATVNYENGDSLTRGFKTLKTPHLDAICKIETTINEIAAADLTKKVTNGVMGVIFNYKEDEEAGTASFSIAGVRYNQKKAKVEAYVETFKDVDVDALEDELPAGKHATGTLTYAATAFGAELDGDFVSDKKMTIWIDIIANDGTTDGRTGAEGTYTVNFYAKNPERKKGTNNALSWKDGVTPVATWTIEAAEVNNKIGEGTNKKLTNMQADIGFYANIQPNETLIGSWNFDAISKEAEEIAE